MINQLEKDPKEFDKNLEALRGFLALFVASSHIIGVHNRFHPERANSIFTFQPPGHLSVLMFFILSGHVIELTNRKKISLSTISTYLKRRIIRIYPIYFTSIVLALLVTNEQYSWTKIIHNLTFTQVIYTDIIGENAPTWSLCYEILYYLLFIPIVLTKVTPFAVIAIALGVGLVNFNFYPKLGSAVISSSAFGFVFWVTGLLAARYFTQRQAVAPRVLISSLLLFLSLSKLDVLTPFFNYRFRLLFHYDVAFPTDTDWFNAAISFYDLAFIPYGLLLILNFTGKHFLLRKYSMLLVYTLPSYAIYIHLKRAGANLQLDSSLIIPIALYISSVLILFFRNSVTEQAAEYLLRIGTNLGGISYGIYITHYPIVYALRQTSFFDVSGFAFLPRFLGFIAAVLFLSYLLEKKLQPWVKQVAIA